MMEDRKAMAPLADGSHEPKKVVLAEGRFMRFVQKGPWEYFERNNCTDIVIILAMTAEKKVLFVEQYRPPLDRRVIEFPAGLVNDHYLEAKRLAKTQDQSHQETVLSAAKRELLEETGYEAREMTQLLQGPVSGGATSDLVTMVHAQEIHKVGAGGGDSSEAIIVHEVLLDETDDWLKAMEAQGCLVEPKVYAGLYFLKGRLSHLL